MTRMTLTTPTIVARPQKRKMTVATCVSANGKPPSVIKWDTRLKGEATFQETRNQNGTVTVRSNYVVVPSRETHKQKLTCIVTYRNEKITDSVVLNVQCKNLHSYIIQLTTRWCPALCRSEQMHSSCVSSYNQALIRIVYSKQAPPVNIAQQFSI